MVKDNSNPNKLFYIITLCIGIIGIIIAVIPTDSTSIFWISTCPRIIQQSLPWLFTTTSSSLTSTSLNTDTENNNYELSPEGLRYYTLEELRKYDGNNPDLPIYLGMNGDIFDVTEKGKQFYGKNAAYQIFAGKDATRALTLGSLDDKDIYERTDTDDFNEQQLKALKEQHDFYLNKYPRIGKIKK